MLCVATPWAVWAGHPTPGCEGGCREVLCANYLPNGGAVWAYEVPCTEYLWTQVAEGAYGIGMIPNQLTPDVFPSTTICTGWTGLMGVSENCVVLPDAVWQATTCYARCEPEVGGM